MWNGVKVWGRYSGVKSTFSPAFPNLFLKQKVYTPPFPQGDGGWQGFCCKFIYMTQDQQILLFFLVLLSIALWVFRKTPVVGFLWVVWKTFWIVLVAVFLADYAKKELKGWWNKDWSCFGRAGEYRGEICAPFCCVLFVKFCVAYLWSLHLFHKAPALIAPWIYATNFAV